MSLLMKPVAMDAKNEVYKEAAKALKAVTYKFNFFGNPSGKGVLFVVLVGSDDTAKKQKVKAIANKYGKIKSDWHYQEFDYDALHFVTDPDFDWRNAKVPLTA